MNELNLSHHADLVNDSSFADLQAGLKFEAVGKGRAIAIAVVLGDDDNNNNNDAVPIVRTTTVYQEPAQVATERMRQLMRCVKREIEASSSVQLEDVRQVVFNNAMCEQYTGEYRKMGFHSDQTTDLAPGSVIAIASFYDSRDATRRKLVIDVKERPGEGEAVLEIVLEHGTVVWFDMPTNARNVHKIVPVDSRRQVTGTWLGITMRQSTKPRISRLANADERVAFLRLRAQENATSGAFTYPPFDFTISPSDLLPVAQPPASAAEPQGAASAAESRPHSATSE
jgi:hypothetical protein